MTKFRILGRFCKKATLKRDKKVEAAVVICPLLSMFSKKRTKLLMIYSYSFHWPMACLAKYKKMETI